MLKSLKTAKKSCIFKSTTNSHTADVLAQNLESTQHDLIIFKFSTFDKLRWQFSKIHNSPLLVLDLPDMLLADLWSCIQSPSQGDWLTFLLYLFIFKKTFTLSLKFSQILFRNSLKIVIILIKNATKERLILLFIFCQQEFWHTALTKWQNYSLFKIKKYSKAC